MRPHLFTWPTQKKIIIIIVFFAILGIVLKVLSKKDKKGLYNKIYKQLSSLFITNGIFLFFLLLFNYEFAYFLAARFWYLLVGVEMAVWLFFIYKNFSIIPKRREELEKEREYKKYIP